MKKISGIFLLSLLLTACGQTEEKDGQTSDNNDPEQPIEVEMEMAEKAEQGEEVEIGAFVTQGEEKVTDANEVLFEIWKEGDKAESEEFLAEEPEDEKYSITHTFEEEGIYHVTAHVTARGMHSMPTEEITVGQSVEKTEDNGEETDIHAGHQHGSPVTADLQSPSELKAGEEMEISFQVAEEGEPIRNARVRLEIWQKGDETREWVDAEEESGLYIASHTFEESGDYMMTVHIEDEEDLHEHVDKMVSVK
ncbi:FixH family protein [Alteribacillus bidgolensis]|uniref:YtkA-like n=1 Tax=Alteribacillus bidgolensis TaxID=930129 RepID=A0A1G8IMF4_9BACI|nr:FixH family protein [Alteribacillus bidgolensis]SDI19690.1 YtkA-like [Alteribacillus bidgolensis]